jgi:hypothetical protein
MWTNGVSFTIRDSLNYFKYKGIATYLISMGLFESSFNLSIWELAEAKSVS